MLSSENTPSVPVFKLWKIHLHTLLCPYVSQNSLLDTFPSLKFQMPIFKKIPNAPYDLSCALNMDFYSLCSKEIFPQVSSPDVMICLVLRAKSRTQFIVSDMFYLQDNLKCQVWWLKFFDLEFFMSYKILKYHIFDKILYVHSSRLLLDV